jgi:hypothetical protein
MGHENFLGSLSITIVIVCIMWTFVLFFVWNKSIDVKFGLSFKFMTCNNLFDVFVDIYYSFPMWSGCIDGQ